VSKKSTPAKLKEKVIRLIKSTPGVTSYTISYSEDGLELTVKVDDGR
jgi:hypothetical protein